MNIYKPYLSFKGMNKQSNNNNSGKKSFSKSKFKNKTNNKFKSSNDKFNYNSKTNEKNKSKFNSKNKFSNSQNKNKSFFLENYEKLFINSNQIMEVKKKIQNEQYIRVNSKDSKSEEDIVRFIEKKLRIKLEKSYLPRCYKIKKSFFSVSGTLPFLAGDAYLQDIASQLPLNIFDFSKFENKKIKILDMCSSPGSKITQMTYFLDKFNIDYEIYANELQQNRLKQLFNNIQKNNSNNVKIICSDALNLNFKNEFDIIFLDAPCSGNLILDRNWLQKRDKKGILENSSLQKKLLKKAKEMCKKDGYISYSTCSMEYEENEENVLYAIDKLQLISIDEYSKQEWTFPYTFRSIDIVKQLKNDSIKSKKLQYSIRIHPPLSNSQGFFITIFQNK